MLRSHNADVQSSEEACFFPEPRPRASRGDYRAFLERVRKGGDYFPTPRCWPVALGCQGTIFVAYVLNVLQANADSDGWGMVTARFVADRARGIGLRVSTQAKVIRRLTRLRILEQRTIGGKRHLRIDLTWLATVIERAAA